MKIRKSITINLSEGDLKNIVMEHLNNDGYKVSLEDIEFNVGVECRGYGMGEHEEPCLYGCNVHCKEKMYEN